MKLFKPSFVHNSDKPIFSVDIHPKGEKFATGGQGNDSGTVIIWNLAPVLSEKAEQDPQVPKILCQMDNHLSCVNVVRWSRNGQMLASGADDKLLMIWKRTTGGSGSFGSGGMTKNAENWRCCATLRGHAGDVLDLAWSPQDRWLASCSVDNTIIVWDAQSFPTIISMLKGHTGLVKGVTWDPVGKFLASQSDDRTVKIWKTSNWICQSTITEPFEECGGTTHILRLSWSPDGQYLVTAHAMNSGGPTAQIIERDGWKCDKDFVGHRKAVTCVRFHNSILKRQAPKTSKSQQYCCLAIGSRDRSLSVWMTALQRPLLVVRDLFEDSILDLSWSTDGYILLVCSSDGTLACLQFTEEQLGRPLSEDDKNILYQRMYGKDATMDISVQAEKELIIENAELLNTTKDKVKPPQLIPGNTTINDQCVTPSMSNNSSLLVNKKSQSMVSSSALSPNKPILKQVETRTSDGKRRITPMFIPLSDDITPTSLSITTDDNHAFSSSSRSSSKIVIEKLNENSSQQSPIITNGIDVSTHSQTIPNKLDTRLLRRDTPSKTINECQSLDGLGNVTAGRDKMDKNTVPVVRMNAGKATPIVGGQCVKTMNEYRMQIANDNTKTPLGNLTRVVCVNLTLTVDKKVWELFIGSSVTCFSVSSNCALIGCIDGTIRILEIKNGQLVFPILNLSSPILHGGFSPNSKYSGVLAVNGCLRVWNMKEGCIYLNTSCQDILNGGYVNMFYIVDEGIPFITTSTGLAYSYSRQLESWMVVNASDPVTRTALTGSYVTNIKNMKSYPLSTVQFISNSFQSKSKSAGEITDNPWEPHCKTSFVENQIQLCQTINSPNELRHWYSMLGFNLAHHGSEKKVRQILDDLLGPVMSLSSDIEAQEKHKILSVKKHDLLKDVLQHFRNETKWQRIYMEYTDQVNEFENGLKKTPLSSVMDLS